MEYKEFKKKGYTIQVNYDMTDFMEAEIDPMDLPDTTDENDLQYHHEVTNDESFNSGSAIYSIWTKQVNMMSDCVADELSYDELKDYIKNKM